MTALPTPLPTPTHVPTPAGAWAGAAIVLGGGVLIFLILPLWSTWKAHQYRQTAAIQQATAMQQAATLQYAQQPVVIFQNPEPQQHLHECPLCGSAVPLERLFGDAPSRGDDL